MRRGHRQQLLLQPLLCDRKVEQYALRRDLGLVVRVRQLRRHVEAEGRAHL